ncbi:MAG: AMIN domain-containing protein [Alphaproteobacteria bacterium]|nr:MAG: AMIN domain-containing protein [Alphaproteobacteria bacterium]
MTVRATSLVLLLFWALLAGGAFAAERTGAAGPSARTPSNFPLASDIRVGGDDAQTRMVVDFSEKIDIRAFTLADPYRVVIDMPQVAFQLRPKTGETGHGLIKTFRYGLVMPGGSRIVIDLARPARIDKAVVLEAGNDQPARLVLDLSAIDREAFMRLVAVEPRTAEPRKSEPESEHGAGDPRPLIVIDPGHGGIDNGTKAATGEMEKTIVLEFCLMLRDKIEKVGKYRVVMTRTDDNFVPLRERLALARAREASLFVSIHVDALARGEGDAQGATVYTLSERASDPRAARLAEAENRADVIAGLDLSSEPTDIAGILIDLARRETKTFSVQFAQALVNAMKSATRLHQNPLKSASFVVLKAPDVPSVLVELGFVTNKTDLKSLISQEWRARTADSMVQAIDTYFTTRLAVSGQN